MDKVVWKGEILPGMRDEYIRRHDEIWPEMVAALKASGITNYSIWNHGNELIGYYECPDAESAAESKRNSEVMQRWSASMRHVMRMVVDEATQKNVTYEKVFEMD